ncbi:DUF924 family protein [Neisseria chenwenguii]|uniref:Uncharacterized protein n=1 Tax=Neisseria chenwenguii TaxID=1853278 RepID=A0A220S224_9NEIS|nr:DUF924 family protein [Neisseria chenwenguii]ASK27550.1 hypothetical protein BG910_07145 [Neisseria chenwenguii]ROV55628.1 DUF924 domain-containing protein [Neisseria chenwenguii]
MTPNQVLNFWFAESSRPFWFAKSDEFDAQIRVQFFNAWQQAARGELAAWRDTLQGRLAEIILLDQFSRNLWRGSAQAFAQDGMALVLAQEAVKQADFAEMGEAGRNFMLLPMMHSESPAVHAAAVPLFERFSSTNTLDFEMRHKAIIDRFGRYPHRNETLGRETTAEEAEFLQQEGSSF